MNKTLFAAMGVFLLAITGCGSSPTGSIAPDANDQNPDANSVAVGEPNGQSPDAHTIAVGEPNGPQREPGDTPLPIHPIAVGEELPSTQVKDSEPGVVVSDGLPIAPGEVHGLPAIQKTDIRGSVSTLEYASETLQVRGVVATIFVEGAIEADTHIDKARVTITRDTQIIEQQGQDRRNVGIDALLANQRVQISFTGPVMESYPVQATASEIVILK